MQQIVRPLQSLAGPKNPLGNQTTACFQDWAKFSEERPHIPEGDDRKATFGPRALELHVPTRGKS